MCGSGQWFPTFLVCDPLKKSTDKLNLGSGRMLFHAFLFPFNPSDVSGGPDPEVRNHWGKLDMQPRLECVVNITFTRKKGESCSWCFRISYCLGMTLNLLLNTTKIKCRSSLLRSWNHWCKRFIDYQNSSDDFSVFVYM